MVGGFFIGKMLGDSGIAPYSFKFWAIGITFIILLNIILFKLNP